MKKEQINFNVQLKDAFGNVVKEKSRPSDKEESEVMLDVSIVNIIAHPASVPEGTQLTGMQVLERLNLQQKVASRKEQTYSTDELAIIREAVITLFNKKMLSLDLAGTILKITE